MNFPLFNAIPLLLATSLLAQETTPPVIGASSNSQTLETMVITAESESKPVIQGPFLPDVVDGKIYAGKKTSVIDFDSLPQIQTDNYRQAFSKTPGLLVSELPNNSLLSITSRGIGDPHESNNVLVLKDGVPFVLDMFGYPSVYYAPPLESMDRMEFVRGGASLLYGPQPGGSLNYISHRPSLDKEFEFSTQNLIGSEGFYSNYSSVDGTIGRLSYMINYNHRSGDSFRGNRSAYELNGGTIMLGLDLSSSTRWLLDLDLYRSRSNEPGGLTFKDAPNTFNYNRDRDQPTLQGDYLEVQRAFATLSLEHDFSEATQMIWKVFGGSSSRTSSRQRGTGFGTVPTSQLNTTTEHRYQSLGTDFRLSHKWMAWGNEHQLATGFTSSFTHAPISNFVGDSIQDRGGKVFNDIIRESSYLAFFVENQFKFGRFSVVPAFRFETVHQTIDDNIRRNSTATTSLPLRNIEDNQNVPLGAIGLAYEVTNTSTAYFNLSQGYKPPTFADVLPVQSNVINSDIEAGHTLTYELGYRGKPSSWLNWDLSGFFIDYQDRFGQVGAGTAQTFKNVGQSQNWGIDFAGEVDLISLIAGSHAEATTKRLGNLNFHVAYEWLNADFVDGPLDGKTPQYAPEHLLRMGLTYRWRDRFKISLLNTFVAQHFGNDSNDANFNIPAYNVTDLTFEAKVWKDNVTLIGGINNVFNEDYYSRVRANGIDPAWGRNVYVGVRFNY